MVVFFCLSQVIDIDDKGKYLYPSHYLHFLSFLIRMVILKECLIRRIREDKDTQGDKDTQVLIWP